MGTEYKVKPNGKVEFSGGVILHSISGHALRRYHQTLQSMMLLVAKGLLFSNGYPDFSEWAEGSLSFNKLTGE